MGKNAKRIWYIYKNYRTKKLSKRLFNDIRKRIEGNKYLGRLFGLCYYV